MTNRRIGAYPVVPIVPAQILSSHKPPLIFAALDYKYHSRLSISNIHNVYGLHIPD